MKKTTSLFFFRVLSSALLACGEDQSLAACKDYVKKIQACDPTRVQDSECDDLRTAILKSIMNATRPHLVPALTEPSRTTTSMRISPVSTKSAAVS